MNEPEKKSRFYASGNYVYWRGVCIPYGTGGLVTADRPVCEMHPVDVMTAETLAALLNAGYEALGGPKF
jgi:hypothetical protein